MTIKELIEKLQKYPENKEVKIYPPDYDYDDNPVALFPSEIYENDEIVIIETV